MSTSASAKASSGTFFSQDHPGMDKRTFIPVPLNDLTTGTVTLRLWNGSEQSVPFFEGFKDELEGDNARWWPLMALADVQSWSEGQKGLEGCLSCAVFTKQGDEEVFAGLAGFYNWSQRKKEAATTVYILLRFQASYLVIALVPPPPSLINPSLDGDTVGHGYEDSVFGLQSRRLLLTSASSSQRTHINTHTVGLLLHHALDDPSQGGAGLTRVVRATHEENEASKNAMIRMGAKEMGVSTMTRWDGHDTDGPGMLSRVWRSLTRPEKTWLSSITSEDWNQGVRAKVDELMARPVRETPSEPVTLS